MKLLCWILTFGLVPFTWAVLRCAGLLAKKVERMCGENVTQDVATWVVGFLALCVGFATGVLLFVAVVGLHTLACKILGQ